MSETFSPVGAIAKYVKYEIPRQFKALEAKLIAQLTDTIIAHVASIPVVQGKDGAGIEAPQWVPGIYRKGTIVHDNQGQFFKAKVDTTEKTDNREHWDRLGKCGFRFCGGFKSDFTYEDGDLVVKDYSLMLFLGGEFRLIAGRGKQGERGEKGKPGADGIDGVDGKAGDVIDVFEMSGSKIVLVKRAADGTTATHELDLSPIFKLALDLQQERLDEMQKHLAEHTIQATKEFVLNHPADEKAIPLRFWRGMWRIDEKYSAGDAIDFGGYVYVAKRDSKGIVPYGSFLDPSSAAEYWSMLCRSVPEFGSEGTGGGGGGGWNAVNATQTERGIIMLATEQEALDGTNTSDAITPATLQAKFDSLTAGSVSWNDITGKPPLSVRHDFADSTAIGTFTHNMQKNPSVRVVDSGGNWWVPKSISFPTLNTIIVEFDLSFGGTMILS